MLSSVIHFGLVLYVQNIIGLAKHLTLVYLKLRTYMKVLLDSRHENLNASVKKRLRKPDQVENIEFLNENRLPGLDKYK